MERPQKRVALDASVGLLAWLPADLWNYIASSLLSPSDRLELRSVCRFFHSVCWRRGVSLKWPDVVLRRGFHDALNTWSYLAELRGVEAADSSARGVLGSCSSLTSLTFASADEQPSSALWLPSPSAFPLLKRVCFELDDCLTGDLGAWACGLTSLTSVELTADDSSSCRTWNILGDRDADTENSDGDSCSSVEDDPESTRSDLARLPIDSLLLTAEDPLPSHKLSAIGRALHSRLLHLELRLGNAENPISSPDLSLLSLLTRLRSLSLPSIEHAGRLRLPPLPSLETLELQLHDTTFSLRCLTPMTSLRSLRVSSSFSEQRTGPDLVAALRSLFNLTDLNLSHSPEELDLHRVLATDLTCLSLLTSLTRVKLRANFEPLASEDLDAFTRFPRLACLELSYCDLRALAAPHSWSPLSHLSLLSVLKLKGTPLAPNVEPPLAASLASLPHLSTLHLELQPEWPCTALFVALAGLSSLRVLSFGPLLHAQLVTLIPAFTLLHSLSFWPQSNKPAVNLCTSLPQLQRLRFAPLTSWIELTPHPFLLLKRVPEACITLFYEYGYLHQMQDTAVTQ